MGLFDGLLCDVFCLRTEQFRTPNMRIAVAIINIVAILDFFVCL